MMDPVTMMKEGGPFMYLVVLALMPNQLGVLVLFATQLARVRLSAAVWILFATLPLFVGVVGTFFGLGATLSAIQYASPAMHAKMAGNGIAVSQYSMFIAAWGSALTLLSYALATGLALLIRPGKSARFTIGGAVIALGVAVFGGLAGLVFSGLLAGLVGAMTGFALFLGGLRFPEEVEADRARVVASRAAIGAYGVLALGCAAIAHRSFSVMDWFFSQSMSNREVGARIMIESMEWLHLSLWGLVGLATVMLLTTALIVVPGLKDLGRRAVISGVFSVFVLLPTAGVLAGVQLRQSKVAEEARPIGEVRVAALESHGVQLMRAAPNMSRPYPASSFTIVGDRLLLDDQPVGPGERSLPEAVAVEAAGGALFSVVASHLREQDGPICLAVDAGEPNCLWFWILQPKDQEDTNAVWVRSTVEGWDVHSPGAEPEEWGPQARARWTGLGVEQVQEHVQAAKRGPDGARAVHVWLDSDGNIADIVGLISGLSPGRAGRNTDPVVRLSIDPAPRFPVDEATIEEAAEGKEGFEASVAAVVKHKRAEIDQCYRSRLAKNPSLRGRVTVQINVGPGGQVINTRVGSSTIGDPKVEQCLVSLFRTVEFEAPGSIEVVRVPLNFSTN